MSRMPNLRILTLTNVLYTRGFFFKAWTQTCFRPVRQGKENKTKWDYEPANIVQSNSAFRLITR